MAITLIANTSNNTNNVATMSLNVPAGTIDDDVIIFFGSCDGIGYALPSGFISIRDVATGGSHKNILAYRVASSEPASYTITTAASPTGERGWGCFATYRGIDTADVLDQSTSNTGGSDATAVLSTLTPALNDSLVVGFVGLESGNNGNSVAPTWPSSLTVRNDNVNGPTGTGNASSAGAFADVIQTTAGAVVGNVSLSGGNTFWGAMSASFNPAAAEGISSVDPSSFNMINADIDINGLGFVSTQTTGTVYLSDASTLAGSANEVNISSAVNTWNDTLINLNLTSLSAGELSSLQTLGPGARFIIVLTSASDEFSSAVTLSRPPAFEMIAGLGTNGATTQRLTGFSGTFGGGQFSETVNPSATSTDIADDGNREDVWSIQATAESIDSETYDFRVLYDGVVADTITQTPQVTIGAAPAGAGTPLYYHRMMTR